MQSRRTKPLTEKPLEDTGDQHNQDKPKHNATTAERRDGSMMRFSPGSFVHPAVRRSLQSFPYE